LRDTAAALEELALLSRWAGRVATRLAFITDPAELGAGVNDLIAMRVVRLLIFSAAMVPFHSVTSRSPQR